MMYVTSGGPEVFAEQERKEKAFWEQHFAQMREELRQELAPIKDIDWTKQ